MGMEDGGWSETSVRRMYIKLTTDVAQLARDRGAGDRWATRLLAAFPASLGYSTVNRVLVLVPSGYLYLRYTVPYFLSYFSLSLGSL